MVPQQLKNLLAIVLFTSFVFTPTSIFAESFTTEKQFVVRHGLVPGNKLFCGKNSYKVQKLFLIDRMKAMTLSRYISQLKKKLRLIKNRGVKKKNIKLIRTLEQLNSTYSLKCQSTSNPENTPSPTPSPTPLTGLPKNSTPIVLPIEVMGVDGTTKSVVLPLSEEEIGKAKKLYLRIHNLSYEDKVSVAINEHPYFLINNSSVEVEPLARQFGGIGGGFSTIKITVPINSSILNTGDNKISFRFNFTDGVSSGFRVIDMNLLDANQNRIITNGRFIREEPSNWKPALNNTADIAAGKMLWMNRQLFDPGAGKMIQARCQHCHVTDGSDLKYFNFSDYSITTRAQFHGLTLSEGKQLAAYIRSLPSIAPGRPWDPPFQPGAGIDSKPVAEWAAGAGLDAVLEHDEDMIAHLFPKGIRPEEARPEANIKAREIPVAFQLPDWNSWLPTVHPIDGFGATVTPGVIDNNCATASTELIQATQCGFNRIIDALEKKKARNGSLVLTDFTPNAWMYYTGKTLRQSTPPPIEDADWTAFDSHRYYSIPQYLMVKQWEIMQRFQLEGTAPTSLDPSLRRWVAGQAFATSPRMVGIPRDKLSLRGNSRNFHTYLGWIWYHLQLILNDGNRAQSANTPIDWGYAYGHIKDLGNAAELGQTGLITLWAIKGLQLKNMTTPADGVARWGLRIGLRTLYDAPFTKVFYNVSQNTLKQLLNALTTALIDELSLYPNESFFYPTSGVAVATPVAPGPQGSELANDLWASIPKARFLGISPDTINKMLALAKRLFPPPSGYTWEDLRTTRCRWVYPGAQEERSYKRHLVKCDSEEIFYN